jgi:hypothetical protein
MVLRHLLLALLSSPLRVATCDGTLPNRPTCTSGPYARCWRRRRPKLLYLRDPGTGLTVVLLTNRDYPAGTATGVVARDIARLVDPSIPDDPMDKE